MPNLDTWISELANSPKLVHCSPEISGADLVIRCSCTATLYETTTCSACGREYKRCKQCGEFYCIDELVEGICGECSLGASL